MGKDNQSLLGFYSPETKYLYIIPARAGERKLWALRIHESIHALQDQWFNLELIHKNVKNIDEEQAISALIEGEAVYLMMETVGKGSWRRKMLHGEKAHPNMMLPTKTNYFVEQKIFIYRKGAQFVNYLVDKGGWKAMDRAFENRPISSAEILHPQKYIDGYKPQKITAPKIDSTKWNILEQGVLGEANLAILLKVNNIESSRAEKLASLWNGDAYLFSQSKKYKNLYYLIYHLNIADKNSTKDIMGIFKNMFPHSTLSQRDNLIILRTKVKFKK